MEKGDIFEELLENHWRHTYSWRGLEMASLIERYEQPRETILSILREVAHTYPHPDYPSKTTCRSCGMAIVFMFNDEKQKSHPCDPKVRRILGMDRRFHDGRESHYASCPDAEWWREGKHEKAKEG